MTGILGSLAALTPEEDEQEAPRASTSVLLGLPSYTREHPAHFVAPRASTSVLLGLGVAETRGSLQQSRELNGSVELDSEHRMTGSPARFHFGSSGSIMAP